MTTGEVRGERPGGASARTTDFLGLASDWSALIVALAALAAFSVAAFAPQLFNDGDTYWHIAAGQWMLEHRSVLYADPFSYTFAGHAWDTQEWLAEVVMALVFRWGSWSGLAVLFGIAAGAMAFLLARNLSRWLGPLALIVTLILVLGCVGKGMLARPHLLALPLLVVWTQELLDARREERAPRWFFLPLMTLWANLHGSFIVGLVLVVPFAAEAIADAKSEKRKVALAWLGFLGGAIVAALVTPHGFDGLIFPIKLITMTQLPFIREWQSTNFQTIAPLELALLAALYVFLSRGVRVSFFRLLLLLVLLHMALQHERDQTFLALCGALILAEPISIALAAPLERKRIAIVPYMTLAVAFAAIGLAAIRLNAHSIRADGPVSPISALAHVPANLRGAPVLNDYAFGGYLIFAGVKPFIDSRADLYGDAFLYGYRKLETGDRAALDAVLRKYGVRWAILSPGNLAGRLLEAEPNWRRVYGDAFADVYVRTGNGISSALP